MYMCVHVCVCICTHPPSSPPYTHRHLPPLEFACRFVSFTRTHTNTLTHSHARTHSLTHSLTLTHTPAARRRHPTQQSWSFVRCGGMRRARPGARAHAGRDLQRWGQTRQPGPVRPLRQARKGPCERCTCWGQARSVSSCRAHTHPARAPARTDKGASWLTNEEAAVVVQGRAEAGRLSQSSATARYRTQPPHSPAQGNPSARERA